jgi:transcriptional regulator with XRE-family HTH domain
MTCLLSYEAEQAVRQLGRNLAMARKRRRWRQRDIEARTGLSRSTIRRIEAGDPSVTLQNYLLVMSLYGSVSELARIAEPDSDDIGRSLEQSVPARVRVNRPLDNNF